MSEQPDIVDWGRRWQKAWTSHPAGANNCVGDSFGQLTDEIERLRQRIAGLVAQDEVKSGFIRELDDEIDRLRSVLRAAQESTDPHFVISQALGQVEK